jgi:hypothetical protein
MLRHFDRYGCPGLRPRCTAQAPLGPALIVRNAQRRQAMNRGLGPRPSGVQRRSLCPPEALAQNGPAGIHAAPAQLRFYP